MAPNERFGRLLNEGIFSVTKRQGKNKRFIESEIAQELGFAVHTVERWQRGHVPNEPEHVAFLVRYCVTYGRVGRSLAESILIQARYPDREKLLKELFPSSEDPPGYFFPRVYQNLPPQFGAFLGREADMARVLEGLASRWPLISIEGIGGVGKTSLAIEIGRRCMQGSDAVSSPLFAVVWISARDNLEQKRWLKEILDTIAQVLDHPVVSQLSQLSLEQKRAQVDQLLRAHHVLVIVDNFETMEDPELTDWMQQVPEPSKILITSRHKQLRSVWAIHLKGLDDGQALALVRGHARRLGLRKIEESDAGDLLPLVSVTGGNPKAMVMALGHLKSGCLGLHEIVDGLHAVNQTVGDIFDYLFARDWAALMDKQDAQHVLLAMSFFAGLARKEAIGAIAGLKGFRLDEALAQLVELSLLDVSEKLEETKPRYSIHPLTRAFVTARLIEDPDWEKAARERWVSWYLDFTKEHGGLDGEEWSIQYDLVQEEWENLLALFGWCAARDRYQTLRNFWGAERILEVASLYGYWSDRVTWLEWILEAAGKFGDQAGAVEAMVEAGFTLTQMGQVEKAKELLERAWDLHHHARPTVKAVLAENFAQLCIHMKHFPEAESWLRRAEKFLRPALRAPRLPELIRLRHVITIKYYYGVIYIEQGKHANAQTLFGEVFKEARKLGWHRAMIYGQQFLGDIARVQGRYDEAEDLLKAALAAAERNKDRRRAAYCKRSLALLKFKQNEQNNLDEVLYLVQEALDGFQRLGMHPEAEQTHKWQQQLLSRKKDHPLNDAYPQEM
jgi:tetratricopeptide (TPR) repeat protein